MDRFGTVVAILITIALAFWAITMMVAPMEAELVSEEIFETQGHYKYNGIYYKIVIDTVYTDSMYNEWKLKGEK